MKRAADAFKHYLGANPFNDIQGRNFSDEKIVREFQPISKFWTLFNNQHEVIIGTRGSGKTFLLKMMRRSMLRHIDHPMAQTIVSNKEFLSLYVPMHLEFVRLFSNEKIKDENKKDLFLLMFNCHLAHSLVLEVQDLLRSEQYDVDEEYLLTAKVCSYIDKSWFGGDKSNLYTFDSLLDKINGMFHNIDPDKEDWRKLPIVFRRQLCSPLLAVKEHIESLFKLSSPTWIICIDEAEFLNESIQKIINGVLRSNSDSIAIKIATLPFHHITLETTEPGISIGEGDDFVYSSIDLLFDSTDFVELTNKLCKNRLNGLKPEIQQINELKDFLGTVGDDSLIDYYRLEVGEALATEQNLEARIVSQFSPKRKEGSKSYSNRKQTIYKKYSPVLFVRDMYNKSKAGNSTPGWYAGADIVRKVSQGNPRLFIQLMHALFDRAKDATLEPKEQHRVIMRFAEKICGATKSLQSQGPIIGSSLEKIAQFLQDRVHGQYIVNNGTAFTLSFADKSDFENNRSWIQLAIAHSRLIVDDEVKNSNIEQNTVYLLSNSYAVQYWLPMRKGDLVTISSSEIAYIAEENEVRVSTRAKPKSEKAKEVLSQQLTLFDCPEDNS